MCGGILGGTLRFLWYLPITYKKKKNLLSQLNKVTTMGWQVQNAIDFLTKIGALDENENLTNLG